ncbi:MAG TPA: thiamine pyrophosphate-binding protein [Pyrinomonadaceae bacterium]|nr:thiamine pyrophosphate-binding protein [Pyrinomonadaceae bacterium]
MKVSDYIVSYLESRGVECVFEMSGGMIAHLLDSLHKRGRIRVVSMHHEQAAAFAADAAGRMTGVPGVAMATSGPGATNLLTGIGSCYFDSSPAVFITGQVNRNEQKGERAIRQLGFQETDIVPMAVPVTKAAWRVREPEEVPTMLERAFALAMEGRPGPVLLDIPMDVQRAEINVTENVTEAADNPSASTQLSEIDGEVWESLFTGLEAAKRPLILAGGGIASARSLPLFRSFVRRLHVPVVNSLMGVDALPFADPLRVGMIGSYGNRWANISIGRSDFLLVLGSRLDVRQTGSQTAAFKGERVIFHVDCESGEINNRVAGCRPVVSGLKEFLSQALSITDGREFAERKEWREEIETLRRAWPDTNEPASGKGINPNALMHQLSAVSTEAAAYVVDVGQHQMWAAQSLEIGPEQRFLTSGGMGSMGFALPAAIGACFSAPSRAVVLIAGDGGFQSNIQELETVSHHRLPVKMVVLNNGCHGMVRQFQESYFESRYQSTLWGYSAPDFAAVAEAYKIRARTIETESEIEEALRLLWMNPMEPALLQVMIDTYANAYPKIAFGSPMTEMEPLVEPPEVEDA